MGLLIMLRGTIALGTLRTSVVLALRLVVQASTLLLVARMLGAEQFGAFAGASALAVLMGACSTFGTHVVLLAGVAKDPWSRDRILPWAIPCTLVCGIVLFIAYLSISFAAFGAALLPFRALLLIGFAEILLQPLFALMTSEHHALGRVARAQLLQLSPLGLRLMVALSVAVLGLADPFDAYVLGYTLASLVALGLGAMMLPARWPSWHNWRLPIKSEWREGFGYAAMNITKAGPAELDKTISLKLLPPISAGVYAASARVVGAVTLPVAAMILSALPRMFREAGRPAGLVDLLVWMYAAAACYSVALAAAVWVSSPLLEQLFGNEYLGIADMVRWLCIAIPGMALRLVAGNTLMALGKPWMRVVFEVVGMAVLIFSAVGLVGRFGALGLPLAVAISEWLMTAVGTAMILFFRPKRVSRKVRYES